MNSTGVCKLVDGVFLWWDVAFRVGVSLRAIDRDNDESFWVKLLRRRRFISWMILLDRSLFIFKRIIKQSLVSFRGSLFLLRKLLRKVHSDGSRHSFMDNHFSFIDQHAPKGLPIKLFSYLRTEAHSFSCELWILEQAYPQGNRHRKTYVQYGDLASSDFIDGCLEVVVHIELVAQYRGEVPHCITGAVVPQ